MEEFKKRIDQEKKIRKILYLSLGLTECSYLLPRGGDGFIDVDYIKCEIAEGLNYLDDNQYRNLIGFFYSRKRKDRIIDITGTALCHLLHRYGRMFLATPIGITFCGSTNLYQTLRKALVSVLMTSLGPMDQSTLLHAVLYAFFITSVALRMAFNNLDSLPSTPVYLGLDKKVKSRFLDSTDVVVLNYKKNRDKIIMTNPGQEHRECWLTDQAFFNSNCQIKSTEIPNAIDLVSPDLKYDEVVNMQDVTGLDRVDLSDMLDLKPAKPYIPKSQKAKRVNFLDKFPDSGPIDEAETWDVIESMVQEKLNFKEIIVLFILS